MVSISPLSPAFQTFIDDAGSIVRSDRHGTKTIKSPRYADNQKMLAKLSARIVNGCSTLANDDVPAV